MLLMTDRRDRKLDQTRTSRVMIDQYERGVTIFGLKQFAPHWTQAWYLIMVNNV